MWRGTVGKFVDLQGVESYVNTLNWTDFHPSFIVVHNTSAPNLATYAGWRAHPEKHGNWSPEQWSKNLSSYYMNQGWQGGPHAFVCPDGILLFTPFNVQGTHSPSWNSRAIGIETVGEFENEPFDNGVRSNLIGTLGILHRKLGLDPADYKLGARGLHFHKEDPGTTHKQCPGKNIVKSELVANVVSYMNGHPVSGQDDRTEHVHIPAAVHVAPTGGMTDEELHSILWAQRQLIRTGFLKPTLSNGKRSDDGQDGPTTQAAVRAFEAAKGLVVDRGIAGPVVRATLKSVA
jgi:hypothetical protein